MKTITTGSDFSGVGAFDYAINRVAEAKGFEHKRIYACDWDKFARITYAHNHGEPDYYPHDVYEREIPTESLGIYMTSPPCQAFSLVGKRLGKDDERGILFFNSLEFIKENNPRFFIFENVKGLLSDNKGRTFGEWVRLLGGKSVNGLPVIFPDDDSVPYHLYWQVLNSKDHGVPQNRERVFLIGIRDDSDNVFQFPREEYLSKNISEVLENFVCDKYILEGNEDFHSSHLKILSYTRDCKGVLIKRTPKDVANTIHSSTGSGNNTDKFVFGCKRLTKAIKDNIEKFRIGEPKAIDVYNKSIHNTSPTLTEPHHNSLRVFDGYYVRKLTPRECFRLQDFPESFDYSVVSDSQAYKQAGNSITVRVLEKILLQLPI